MGTDRAAAGRSVPVGRAGVGPVRAGSGAPPRSREAALLGLQRAAGNAAVEALITAQREPEAPGGPVAAVPGTELVAQAPPSMPDVAGLSGAELLAAVQANGQTGALLQALVADGHRDPNGLTNVAFWAAHPELFGTRLDRSQPDFAALAAEWTGLRRGLVAGALRGPAPTNPAPTAPAGTTPAPASPATAAPAPAAPATAAPAPATDQDAVFVADALKSTIDRLPAAQRDRFAGIQWGWGDYPGNSYPIAGMKPDEVARYRADQSLVYSDKLKAFVGKHQEDAQDLFDALAAARPGGGERRVNAGSNAMITEAQFKAADDQAAIDTYVDGQIDQNALPGGGKLNKHAAEAFRTMAAAAQTAGISLSVMSGYRTRASEEATARRITNRKAFGGFSPHALGLAADVSLKVGTSAHADFAEASTAMNQLARMLNSPAYKWIYVNGAQYGFFQYRNEPWHWEYNPPGFKTTFWSEADDAIKGQSFAQPPAPAPARRH